METAVGGKEKSWRPLLILAFMLAFTGAGFVQKYAGLVGVAAYTALMILLVGAIEKWGDNLRKVGERWFFPLAGGACVGLLAMFAILNPWEDGKGPGKSSDRDEGLNLAVERVFRGETPYYPPNPTAGPLSVLPGGVALAAPFVWIGDSGYQNIFWLAAFFAVARRHFKDRLLAMGWLALPILVSPAVAYEYISGGDLIANGIYVPVSFVVAHYAFAGSPARRWKQLVACMLVGLCLTSRSNYPLLLPVFMAMVWRAAGWRLALIATAVVAFVMLLLVVPFYLNDPAGFTPLMSRHKLGSVDHVFPHASWMLAGLTAFAGLLAGMALLVRRTGCLMDSVFRACAVVMMLPMVLLVALQSAVKCQVDMSLMHDRFGLIFLYSALLGWGGCLLGPSGGEGVSSAK